MGEREAEAWGGEGRIHPLEAREQPALSDVLRRGGRSCGCKLGGSERGVLFWIQSSQERHAQAVEERKAARAMVDRRGLGRRTTGLLVSWTPPLARRGSGECRRSRRPSWEILETAVSPWCTVSSPGDVPLFPGFSRWAS